MYALQVYSYIYHIRTHTQVADDDHHECKLCSSEMNVSHVVLPAAAEYRVCKVVVNSI